MTRKRGDLPVVLDDGLDGGVPIVLSRESVAQARRRFARAARAMGGGVERRPRPRDRALAGALVVALLGAGLVVLTVVVLMLAALVVACWRVLFH